MSDLPSAGRPPRLHASPGTPGPGPPPLPPPRGPLSEALFQRWRAEPGGRGPYPRVGDGPADSALAGDDLQLALYACYELHYRGFDRVSEGWEWDPGLLEFRAHLEEAFEAALVEDVGAQPVTGDVVGALVDIVAQGGGPSLSAYAADRATLAQFREICIHRSAYQLKEADPHTWAIPRLSGRPKSAMVAIQADEYGNGVGGQAHAELFAATLDALDLDPAYGAYLGCLPGTTLATVNLVSHLGLHRRHRAAAVGHLAVFEMTSIVPMSRYSQGLARLGVGPVGRRFYDVHVEADEVHQAIALEDMVRGLVEEQPELGAGVLFGARALMAVERRFSERMLGAWSGGTSSLLAPAPLPG